MTTANPSLPSASSAAKRGFMHAALRGAWLFALPLALAALAQHYLFPTAFEARGALATLLLRLGSEQPVAVFVVLFLGLAALARYWQPHLPLLREALPSTKADPGSSGRELARSALTLAVVGLAVLAMRSSLVEPYRVLTASMLPTLEPGDWIAANKLAYGVRLPFSHILLGQRAPKRGDVIAFQTPAQAGSGLPERLVKRVIGLPGDRVAMRHGQPIINGWPVPNCDAGIYAYLSSDNAASGRLVVEFLAGQAYLTVYFAGSEPFSGYLVKPGEVFVLGDNRNNSSDSRAWNNSAGGGLILSAIDGRVATILLGTQRDGSADWGELFTSLRRTLRFQGLDVSELQAGIERCLAAAPSNSTPPAP